MITIEALMILLLACIIVLAAIVWTLLDKANDSLKRDIEILNIIGKQTTEIQKLKEVQKNELQ